jgi:chaperonin GroEL (HSP60 family)
MRQIAANAGFEGSIVVEKVKENSGNFVSMPIPKNTWT